MRHHFYEERCIGFLYELLYLLENEVCTNASPYLNKIAPARQYLDEHFTEEVSPDALSRLCGMSPSYLRRLFRQALGEAPVARYGQSYVPMDECLCRSVLDISGRPYLVFHADFENQSIGALDVCMVEEFFYAFTYTSRTTLHLEVLYGKNDHHKVEGLFKAFARSLSQAMQPASSLLSTKGVL